jgi:hypothetical protein
MGTSILSCIEVSVLPRYQGYLLYEHKGKSNMHKTQFCEVNATIISRTQSVVTHLHRKQYFSLPSPHFLL